MPDLQRESAIDWLHAVEPAFSRRLNTPVRAIEDVAAVHPLLVELGAALDRLQDDRAAELAPRLLERNTTTLLREVLAQLGPARLLCLLAWVDTAGLPLAEDLLDALIRDDRSEAGRALRDTLAELQRQALLARIFHRDRLALLQAVTSSQKGSN